VCDSFRDQDKDLSGFVTAALSMLILYLDIDMLEEQTGGHF
jgi:hypothetical protein